MYLLSRDNYRNRSLDVLRGVAVLMVICYHVGMVSWGWSGVDLFFVLSGFLISGLLFAEIDKTATIRVGRFLIRRGFKIYPPFYAFLATTALFIRPGKSTLLPELFFLHNYRGGILPEMPYSPLVFWGHTWSLAVEEHFYLLLPLLILVLVRFRKLHWIPAIALGIGVLCFSLRVITPYHPDGPESTVLVFPSHLRFDSLFAGVALGYISSYRAEVFARLTRSRWTLLAALGIVPALVCKHWFSSPLVPSVILTTDWLGFSALLLLVVNRRIPFSGLMSTIGRYSYSIYLWHMPMVLLFGKLPPKPLWRVVAIVLSCGVGIAMSKLIEVPALKLRDRFFRKTDSPIEARQMPNLSTLQPYERMLTQ